MKKEKNDKIFRVLFILALVVFLYAGTNLGMIFWEYYRGQQEYAQLAEIGLKTTEQQEQPDKKTEEKELFSVDFKALKDINPDVEAWIWFENMDISYPVVQGEDNEYYLTHSVQKEEIKSGSIFIEAQNQPDLSDDNTFIYGHNMKDKSMFAKLNQFQDEKVFRENPEFYIYREDGIYKYQIFSCYVTDVSWSTFQYQFADKEKYGEWQKITKGRSIYDTGVQPETDQKTVTLVTCTPAGDEARFVVHGALAEKIENK